MQGLYSLECLGTTDAVLREQLLERSAGWGALGASSTQVRITRDKCVTPSSVQDLPVRQHKRAYQYIKKGAGKTVLFQGNSPSVSIVARSEGCNDQFKTGGCGYGFIYVNGVDVSKRGRGLNLVVIDPKSGNVEGSWSFDTYGNSNAAKDMYHKIRGVANGKLVVIAGQDEYTNRLASDGGHLKVAERGEGDFIGARAGPPPPPRPPRG